MNITFHRLEDERFRPDSELYLESLGIIGSVPAAWLILTLVVLLIYLLTRCCDTKNNKVTSLGHTAEFIGVHVPTNTKIIKYLNQKIYLDKQQRFWSLDPFLQFLFDGKTTPHA